MCVRITCARGSGPRSSATAGAVRVPAGIAERLNGIVTGATALIVGIYVFGRINATMPEPATPELANATDTVVATTSDGFVLGGVALIVLVASIMISLLTTALGGGGLRGRLRR